MKEQPSDRSRQHAQDLCSTAAHLSDISNFVVTLNWRERLHPVCVCQCLVKLQVRLQGQGRYVRGHARSWWTHCNDKQPKKKIC